MTSQTLSNYYRTEVQSQFGNHSTEKVSMISVKKASRYNEGCKSPSQLSESTEYSEAVDDASECGQHLSNALFVERNNSRSTAYGNEQSEAEHFDEFGGQISFSDESSNKAEKIDAEETETIEGERPLRKESSLFGLSRLGSSENLSVEEPVEGEEIKDWCERKDKVLKNLASKCKYDWKKIAKKFNSSEHTNFTPLALKQKYKDLSKVSIPLRVKFTHQEDLLIAKYFEVYGCDWTSIASHFADRTAMMLKNRYYSFIRKKNLLQDMLEEVKEGDQVLEPEAEAESVSTAPTQATEEQENEEYQFFGQNPDGPRIRFFSMSTMNPIVFEIENSLSCQLYDKITDIL